MTGNVILSAYLVFLVLAAHGNAQINAMGEESIKCYVCNSANDPRCGDPFDNSTLEMVECKELLPNDNPFICRKIEQTVALDSRVDHRIIRSCGYISENPLSTGEWDDRQDNRCSKKAGTSNVEVTYCACTNNDGCNSAPQFRGHLSFASQVGVQIAVMISGSYFLLDGLNKFRW